MQKRRVVVTGMGMVTPLGQNLTETWQNLLAGQSGVVPVDDFDVSDYPTKIWAKVKPFDQSHVISPAQQRKMDGFTRFGIIAADEAMRDAGLMDVNESLATRFGVAVGAGIGGIATIADNQQRLEKGGPRRVSPFFVPASIINMVAGQISIHFGLKGPNLSVVTACATGTHNIGQAARIIAYGDADCMIAGGAEMTSTPLCLAGFAAARSLSRRNDAPQQASRPWDKDRDGFVMGEGAGIMVLESLEHAEARGAKIYAEVAGIGWSADAYHITAPDEEAAGATRAIEAALKDAQLAPDAVDYINAHGTSTKLNDLIETRAIKQVLGEHAYRIPVSSSKSMIGHLLGAAGAVEAVIAVLAMEHGVAPPTINLDQPDEGCDLNYVPWEPQQRSINVALSNSIGFGGTNGCLAFQRVHTLSV